MRTWAGRFVWVAAVGIASSVAISGRQVTRPLPDAGVAELDRVVEEGRTAARIPGISVAVGIKARSSTPRASVPPTWRTDSVPGRPRRFGRRRWPNR
jgi:hypothetical protein